MDEELREAERKWKAFYEGKPYIIKQLGEITGKELENGWEIAYEDKKSIWHPPSHQHSSIKIGFIGHWGPGRQETWGNPNAATKAAKRYIKRMLYDPDTPIKVVHIDNYKFQPRVLPNGIDEDVEISPKHGRTSPFRRRVRYTKRRAKP